MDTKELKELVTQLAQMKYSDPSVALCAIDDLDARAEAAEAEIVRLRAELATLKAATEGQTVDYLIEQTQHMARRIRALEAEVERLMNYLSQFSTLPNNPAFAAAPDAGEEAP